jgi:hypothetical protein
MLNLYNNQSLICLTPRETGVRRPRRVVSLSHCCLTSNETLKYNIYILLTLFVSRNRGFPAKALPGSRSRAYAYRGDPPLDQYRITTQQTFNPPSETLAGEWSVSHPGGPENPPSGRGQVGPVRSHAT